MIKRNGKRFLSVLLAVCLMLSSLGAYPVYAVTREECTCGTVNERHADGCPLAEQKQETCTCTPVDGVHQEGCALYVAPADEEEPTSAPESGCTCTPVDGVHQAGCNLYVAPASNETEVQMTAGIYLDADRTNLAQLLTAEGAILNGWKYQTESVSAEDRYLGVQLSGLSMDSSKQYQLVIEMDKILFLNQNSDPALSGTTVSFTKNQDLVVNTDSTYVLDKYSLSNLTYLIDSGTESLSLGLPLRFDVKLWDKQSGRSLKLGDGPLLRVYLQEKQPDGSFLTIAGQDVKLLDATVDGSLPYNAGQLNKYLVGGSTSVTVERIGPNETLRAEQYHFYSNDYKGGHYAKTVEIEIKIPTCTVEGVTYTADYKDFGFYTPDGKSEFASSFDAETGILKVTAENFYFAGCKLFHIYLSAPEALKDKPGEYKFSGTISIKENGDVVVTNKALTFSLDNRTEADIKGYAVDGYADVKNPSAVHFLGTLGVRNDAATIDSGKLLVEQVFDVNNTGHVRVTTVRLLSDTAAEEITVTYTLIDADGNPVVDQETGQVVEYTVTVKNSAYNKAATDLNNKSVLFRLPEAQRKAGYYIKTLKYVLNNVPANTKIYAPSGAAGTSAAGTFWGYIVVDTIPAVLPQHTMKVSQYKDDGTTGKVLVNSTVKTKIDEGNKVAYGLYEAGVSSNVVTAGDSVVVSGQLRVSTYPYVSNGCMDNLRIGLILPAGVTVNQAAITATYQDKSSLKVAEVTQRSLENGKILYTIVFEQGKTFGYYSESLGALPTGDRVNFSIQLNSEKTISTQTIKLVDSLFATGLGLDNGASGAWQYYWITDYYDLNANGSTTDRVGCFSSSVTASVTFSAGPAELIITDELVNADGEAGAALPMKSFADILNYNLHVECTEGGRASDFYYIIPIPKTTMTKDPVFVSKCQVDLVLKGEATFSHRQGTEMKLLYSTTPITGYSDALNLTDWSETLPEGKTWVDVTAIKVICAEEQIENGSISVISLPLGYNGEDTEYEHMAGYQIQWSSRGYYYYNVGFNNNAGTKSTDGTTITLNYTRQEPVCFTLTAAKDGNPTAPGASNTYVLDLEVLFYLAQEYRVKQITPYNVNLMGAGYNFDTATSAEANENFRINIAVKNQWDESFQAPMALQKDNDIIGSLGENSRPVFSFTIENADALSDIVTERKVTLTLIGSNGVIVPVEITIKRELAAAEPTASAIVAGKLYAPFEGGTEIQVSRDSAFTAQFVTQYIPANYTGHSLVFSQAPVSGTTITMIDWTYPSTLKFYQYTMGGNTTTVKLTDFQGMGGSGAFTESSETNVVTERLLFIVSFPAGGEPTRDNTIKLIKNLTTDTKIEESSVLKFTTVGKRGFSISASADSVDNGKDFTISYTSGCDVTDSRYANRNLSLVVKPAQGEFPNNARLVVNGTSYYLNAQGCFLVPLRAVHAGSGTVTVCYEAQSGEDISLQISLWASSTANGSKPLMGGQVASPVTVSAKANVDPSFAVTSMSNRLLELEDLANTITVVFRKKNAPTVTVELQKKVGNGYVTQTTVLESVNGKTTADVAQGVFSVNGTSVVIKLSSLTEIGTYRLLFKVSSGSKTIEVPYNFVVVQ